MGELRIHVERGFSEQSDKVKLVLTEPYVLLTPDQAREVAREIASFADSADHTIPYIRVPLVSSCNAGPRGVSLQGRMNRSNDHTKESDR